MIERQIIWQRLIFSLSCCRPRSCFLLQLTYTYIRTYVHIFYYIFFHLLSVSIKYWFDSFVVLTWKVIVSHHTRYTWYIHMCTHQIQETPNRIGRPFFRFLHSPSSFFPTSFLFLPIYPNLVSFTTNSYDGCIEKNVASWLIPTKIKRENESYHPFFVHFRKETRKWSERRNDFRLDFQLLNIQAAFVFSCATHT